MPVFELEHNGKTFEIDAPDVQSGVEAFKRMQGISGTPAPQSRIDQAFEVDASAPKTEVSKLDTFGRAARDGATFGLYDEYRGLTEAAAAGDDPRIPRSSSPVAAAVGGVRMLLDKAGVTGGEASNAYIGARDKERIASALNEAANPYTALAGNVAGALATAPIIPMGAGVAGAAKGGAIGGALYGYGAGDGLAGSAQGAALGGVVGGALGAAGGKIAEKLSAPKDPASQGIISRLNPFKGAVSPEEEAARRVAAAQAMDKGAGLSDDAIRAATEAGQPILNIDRGGEATRALARAAVNSSGDAGNTLKSALGERFESQAPRLADYVSELFPDRVYKDKALEALKDKARASNKVAYARAEMEGMKGVWDETLQTLTSSPTVQEAIKKVAKQSADKSAVGGGRTVKNPFVANADGALSLPEGVKPDFRFWDLTKRALDDKIDTLLRAGEKNAASDVRDLKNALIRGVEKYVPSYAQARSGAARAFGEENTFDAGAKFIGSKLNNEAARDAISKMTAPERALFREGYVAQLVPLLKEFKDNRNIVNSLLSSPAERERMILALGEKKANKIINYIRVEKIMQLSQQAVSGNSSTVAQLMQAGLINSSGGGILGGAYGAMNGDISSGAITGAAIAASLKGGKAYADTRVMGNVAKLLASNDPSKIKLVLNMAQQSPKVRLALTEIEKRLSGYVGGEASSLAQPLLDGTRKGAAEQPSK